MSRCFANIPAAPSPRVAYARPVAALYRAVREVLAKQFH
jgi:hypothetical protein